MEFSSLKKRDDTFDIIKGVCILLMVVGHTCLPMVPSRIICSFHMPAFLIAAGYFAHKQSFKRIVSVGFRRLLIPYLIAYAICLILCALLCPHVANTEILHSLLNVDNPIGCLAMMDGGTLPVWFLFALFWCRLVFNLILRVKNDAVKLVICFAIPLLAVNIYTYGKWPFCLLIGLSALGFYSMGYFLNELNFRESKKIWGYFPVLLMAWFVCLFSTEPLGVWRNVYNGFYILDCLGALAIFLILYIVIEKGKSNNRMWNFLKWCGVNSLIILCVHAIEFGLINYPFVKTLLTQYFLWYSVYVVILLRLIFDIALAFLLSKSFIVRKYIFAQE